MNSRRSPKNERLLGRPNVFPVVALLHYLITSLRGRRSKRNGKESKARDHARGRFQNFAFIALKPCSSLYLNTFCNVLYKAIMRARG